MLDQVGLRDAARVMAETAPMGPRRLRHVESALRILVSAGFSKRDAVRIAYHFNNLVTELAAAEARLRVSEAEYQKAMHGPLPAEIRIAAAAKESADAQAALAQSDWERIKRLYEEHVETEADES